MNNTKNTICRILFLVVVVLSQNLIAGGKLRVAVMPVEGGNGISSSLKEAVRLDLESQLVKSGKVDVLDRDKLKRLSEEMKLSLEGVIDPATMQELGKVTGVSVFLFPRITSAWSQVKRERIPLVNEDEVLVQAGFQLALKLVETETSRILASEKARGSYFLKRMESEGGIPSRGAALASARSRAMEQAGSIILTALYPVKVAHYNANSGVVTLNRGRDALKVGQKLKVFSVGEAIIDPDTGEQLGSDEEQIGLIQITETRSKLSRASILKGRVEVGAICR